MAKNRDDFSEKTKRLAAGRVGYRCSCPTCDAVTIGSSMESTLKTSLTGQAAHICAAAPGGKRYDVNMTPEERSSIDNCIWLCDYHARLIDTDAATYPVEKLRQWKADAEIQSSLALANKDFFATYSHGDGSNYCIMSKILEDLVILGNYQQLQAILSQYKAPQTEALDELVMRYKVILDIYCNHVALVEDLKHYLELPCKSGISAIITSLFGMLMTEPLKLVIDYCADTDMKRLIGAAINGTLEDIIFVPLGSESPLFLSSESKIALSKAISIFVLQSGVLCRKDSSGNDYKPFEEEFFFQLVASVNRLRLAVMYDEVSSSGVISSSDYCFISQNIKKIDVLDPSLKEQLWADILFLLLEDKAEFERMYLLCSQDIKHSDKVQLIRYAFDIRYTPSVVSLTDLLDFSNRTGEYGILLHHLGVSEPSAAARILDEHAYLYKKDCAFLRMRVIKLADVSPINPEYLLDNYKDIYSDNPLYHCLLATVLPDGPRKAESIYWLKTHSQAARLSNFDLLITVMVANKEWDYLVALCELSLPPVYIKMLADGLSQAQDTQYLIKSKTEYEVFLKTGIENKWTRYNLGIVNKKLGFIEEAKRLFQEEYDHYHQTEALKGLIFSRYSTNEYKDDFYLSELESVADCESQNIVAATHMRLKQFSEAQRFFLRALLIDDTKVENCVGLFQASNNLPNISIEDIRENTVCVLRKQTETYNIAIHSPEVLNGIHVNRFAKCEHYSVESPLVSNLLFCKPGDTVQYRGSEFQVESIKSSKEAFQLFAFQRIMESPGVCIMHAKTGEDFIREITPILKSSSENISNAIASYNDSELLPPLTAFSKMTGKDMLASCLFLAYGNSEKIRNNLSTVMLPDTPTFVLNYDSIVFLACIGFTRKLPAEMHFSCSKQVRNQLLSDITLQMQHLEKPQRSGQLTYFNDTIAVREITPDSKRTDYAFLSTLKDFVNSLDVDENGYDYFPSDTMDKAVKEALIAIISDQKLLSEGGSLALAQKTTNSVLVTDDQFLYALANEEKQMTIGLLPFLSIAYKDWKTLLDISKGLQKINFNNYMPLTLYDQIVDALCEESTDIVEGSREIQEWIRSDTDDEPTMHHENVILGLAQDVFNSGKSYLDPNGFLTNCVLDILKKRMPDAVERLINDVMIEVQKQLIHDGIVLAPSANWSDNTALQSTAAEDISINK